MNKKRLLVVGGSGLLGTKLLKNANNYELYSTFKKNSIDFENVETMKLDITNKKDCRKILDIEPDFIVNTAAMTNVDHCERFKEDAYNVNVNGTKNLADIAQQLGSKFIQISSDMVFSGGNNFSERDKPNPANVYGKTKLESEKKASEVPNYLILRPSVIFGWIPFEHRYFDDKTTKSMNFALWILNKLKNKQKLSIVDDQFNTPTLADNLAEIILEMIKKDLTGIYHTSGLSCISRLNFSKKIAKTFGYSEDFITPCSTKELKQVARRSLQTCLNCEKIVNNGIKLLEIDQAIEIMFNQVKKEQPGLISKYSKT